MLDYSCTYTFTFIQYVLIYSPWYKAKSTEEILDCGGTKVKFKISVHLYLKHPEYYDEIITGTGTYVFIMFINNLGGQGHPLKRVLPPSLLEESQS